MKIAFVVHDYHRGAGHGRYVVELAERFSGPHEVHVFANTYAGGGPPDIRFHYVPAWRITSLTTILTFPLPATACLPGGFDIIHAQGLCSLRFNVLTAHICNQAWFHSQRAGNAAFGWKERWFDRLVTPLEKFIYRAFKNSWVIAISDRVRRDLAECYSRQVRVSVIHHGVDLGRFTPENRAHYRGRVRQRLGFAEDEVVFLFVGDLRKGATVALEALRQTAMGKLLFVSRTSPGPYRRLGERLGVEGRVQFCPPTEEIEQYYAAADGFVFPTPYDAFGMVISEAMAAGLPVITSRQAGAAELIDHGREGFLLESSFGPQEIARYLRQLHDDPALRHALGQAGRKRMENHSWDTVAAQTMQVYQNILEAKAA